MKAIICTAVWGDEFVDRFLNYSLRTQLTAGNLGTFGSDSQYLIATARTDAERIKASPIFRELQQLLSVECVLIEDITSQRNGDKYATLVSCHNYFLQVSANFDVIFFGYADAVWAEGSYGKAIELISQGSDVVFTMGYPVVDVNVKALIDDLAEAKGTVPISVPPRTLAQAIYRNLHPMARASGWHREWLGHCPSYVTWDVPGQGLLLRSFHLHPVVIRVLHEHPDFFAPFATTLDEEFVTRIYRWNPRVHVCRSSDELCVCGVAKDTGLTYEMQPLRPVNIGDVANFAEAHAGLLHRELFQHSLRLVANDVCEEQWKSAEDEAAEVSGAITRRLSASDYLLAIEAPAGYEARLRRQLAMHHLSPYGSEIRNRASVIERERGPFVPRLMGSMGRGIVTVLHATRISRMVRIYLLPMLHWRHRLWIHKLLQRLGIYTQLAKSSSRTRRGDWRWWRWLLSWMRIHPLKKRPYTTN